MHFLSPAELCSSARRCMFFHQAIHVFQPASGLVNPKILSSKQRVCESYTILNQMYFPIDDHPSAWTIAWLKANSDALAEMCMVHVQPEDVYTDCQEGAWCASAYAEKMLEMQDGLLETCTIAPYILNHWLFLGFPVCSKRKPNRFVSVPFGELAPHLIPRNSHAIELIGKAWCGGGWLVHTIRTYHANGACISATHGTYARCTWGVCTKCMVHMQMHMVFVHHVHTASAHMQ